MEMISVERITQEFIYETFNGGTNYHHRAKVGFDVEQVVRGRLAAGTM
jgi:hypothetical protein